MTYFVQALQGYMQEKNIGQTELAQLLGQATSTISEWLSGKCICKTQAEVLHKLGLEPLLPCYGPNPKPIRKNRNRRPRSTAAAAAGRVRRRPRSTAAATRVRRAVRALQPKPLGQLSPPLVVAIKKERV